MKYFSNWCRFIPLETYTISSQSHDCTLFPVRYDAVSDWFNDPQGSLMHHSLNVKEWNSLERSDFHSSYIR